MSTENTELSREVQVEQKSKEWLELRKKYITATDVTFLRSTFFDNVKYYGKSFEDFFDKKHGKKEKHNSFALERMFKGELTEEVAKETVKGICLYLNRSRGLLHKYEYSAGQVIVREDWALASLDYALLEDGKIYAPVEVKYTESDKIFESYKNKTNLNLYQLAFQMYVTGCSKGLMLIFFKESTNPIQIKIDTESEQYVNLLSMIDKLKEIHTDICVKKINPCQNELNTLKNYGDDLIKNMSKRESIKLSITNARNNLANAERKSREAYRIYKEALAQKDVIAQELVGFLNEESTFKNMSIVFREQMCKEMDKNKIHVVNSHDNKSIFRKIRNPKGGFTIRIEKM